MEPKDDINAATESLYCFMREMFVWESKYDALYQRDGGNPHFPDAKREIDEIYDRFLTKRERKLGRQTALHAGFPTEYDPDREKVEQSELVKSGKVLISTIWNHPSSPAAKRSHRYTMLFKEGGWLLDKKERFSKFDDKWASVVL